MLQVQRGRNPKPPGLPSPPGVASLSIWILLHTPCGALPWARSWASPPPRCRSASGRYSVQRGRHWGPGLHFAQGGGFPVHGPVSRNALLGGRPVPLVVQGPTGRQCSRGPAPGLLQRCNVLLLRCCPCPALPPPRSLPLGDLTLGAPHAHHLDVLPCSRPCLASLVLLLLALLPRLPVLLLPSIQPSQLHPPSDITSLQKTRLSPPCNTTTRPA